jgi:hypothetical protein
LGLKVLHVVGEVFLGQEENNVEILKRFWMFDSKPMSTLMVPNMKLTFVEN